MPVPFLYDTHYQLDKPFALLHLTIATASPNQTTPDHLLARRLEEKAKTRKVAFIGPNSIWANKDWNINKDAFLYWIGNCQQMALLSRQNAYDYWLMNFIWNETFQNGDAWGHLSSPSAELSKLLLFRWSWLHDASMLVALLWHLATADQRAKRDLLDVETRSVDKMIVTVLGALRDSSQDIRLRTNYRRQITEIRRDGFRYNTRRHKLATHLALLRESGLVVEMDNGYFSVSDGVSKHLRAHPSMADCVRHALLASPLGPGGEFFLQIVTAAFGVPHCGIAELTEEAWDQIINRIHSFWTTIIRWDRKFLGINALAELFLVENLARGRELWPADSWKRFLLERSRRRPEELTIHVGRFGDVQYLRLTEGT